MALRTVVSIVGVLIALIGLSQVAATAWWVRILPSIMGQPEVRVYGVVLLAIGAVLALAALRRLVALRLFVLVLGLWVVLSGAALLVSPGAMQHTVYAQFLSRPHGTQMAVICVSGLIRVLIGGLLVYSATRYQRSR